MQKGSERVLAGLLGLNLALQVFDGVATYAGLRAGIAEGNPLLAASMQWLGITPALVIFKCEACAALMMIWLARHNRLAAPALLACALVYFAWSVGPWTVALARLSTSISAS